MLYDASVRISENIIVYPGDPQFRIRQMETIPKDPLNTSMVEMGIHTGTHVDTPLHCFAEGKTITDFSIDQFCGTCQVLDVTHIPFGQAITRKHLSKYRIVEEDIILFKTQNSQIPLDQFKEDFVYLDQDAARFLIEKEVKIVGIDYLSIDQFDSLTVHQMLLSKNILIYEVLQLSHIPEGQYYFFGGPLKIINSEGAPARVILCDLPSR